jgi:hypothetical protein
MLTAADFDAAAQRLGCDVAAVRAVTAVEARGSGFNPDGSPKTLFEGHKFSKFTQGRYDRTHPDLSYPTWSRQWYGKTWRDEKDRLRRAMALNPNAAQLSASWGLFQIMGFNHAACGYARLDKFVAAMHESEAKHLEAFVAYVIERGLADELRDHRWADFARLYNGPAYAANKYDTKLAAAWAMYA